MSDIPVTFRVGGDSSGFQKAMGDARRASEEASKKIFKNFDMGDVGRTLATALGLNLTNIAEKLVTPFRKSAEMAQELSEVISRAADANIRFARENASLSVQVLLATQDRERLMREIETLSSRNNLTEEEKIRLAQAQLDLIAARREEMALTVKLAEEDARMAKAAAEQFNEQRKSWEEWVDARRKAFDDDMMAILERQNLQKDEAEADRRLAELRREDARSRMSAEARINDLRKEQKDVVGEIAKIEKFIAEGGKLTNDGVNDLVGLKKQLSELQSRIADETERTAKAEQKAAEATQERQRTLAGIAGIRGGRQFNDASDEALRESLRRSEQAVQDIGVLRNIGQELEVARLQAEAQNIRRELDFRSNLRRDVQNLGVEGARRGFQGDPLEFDRVVQQLVQDNRDQRQILAETNTQLRRLIDGKGSVPVIVLNQKPGGG